MTIQTHTLIVGASIAGLASAAALQRHGIEYIIIEKEAQVATPWRNHYNRLHLHTPKGLSHLPYLKFNNAIPQYPSRQQVIEYANSYQKKFNIRPFFNTEATTIKREDNIWKTETTNGIFYSKYIIMATGVYGIPKTFYRKGLESFPGMVLHSSQYKNAKAFTEQKVLVIGFGNSACEIAIDLYEQGAIPSLSVRSPVNIVPRDLLGIPILHISLLMSYLPYRLADAINAPLMRLALGDITKLGLQKNPHGVFKQIKKESKIPVLDIGTIKHIRQGHITIYNDINYIENKTVYFIDGKQSEFDAIIAAIGYERNVADLIDIDENRFEDLKTSSGKQKYFGDNGIYFCGFRVSATGLIREIALEAKKIAKDIAKKKNLG